MSLTTRKSEITAARCDQRNKTDRILPRLHVPTQTDFQPSPGLAPHGSCRRFFPFPFQRMASPRPELSGRRIPQKWGLDETECELEFDDHRFWAGLPFPPPKTTNHTEPRMARRVRALSLPCLPNNDGNDRIIIASTDPNFQLEARVARTCAPAVTRVRRVDACACVSSRKHPRLVRARHGAR